MDNEDDAMQRRLAQERLAMLDAIVAAQSRYAEVSTAIADAADTASAEESVAALLGITRRFARDVIDLPWKRLASASRMQAIEDRAQTAREIGNAPPS